MVKRLSLFLAAFLFSAIGAMAQMQVSGTVVSQDDGEPIVGAAVRVEGTDVGSTTNLDGKFTVKLPQGKHQLTISYIGMKTVQVAARDGMRVVMSSEEGSLDEVVVVAYGTAKRQSITGAVSVVGEEKIKDRIATSVTAALTVTLRFLSSTFRKLLRTSDGMRSGYARNGIRRRPMNSS